MTTQPYDPGPLPTDEAVSAARTEYLTLVAAGSHPVEALERAVTAALAAATVETYAVLVEQGIEQGIDERTRRAEARLAKVTATAQAWTSGTPDQRKAGRMLLDDLGH